MFLCRKEAKRIHDEAYSIAFSKLPPLSRLQPGRTMSSVEAAVQLRHYPATKIQRWWRKHAYVRVKWSFDPLSSDGRIKSSLLLPKRHLNDDVWYGECHLCAKARDQYRLLCLRKVHNNVAIATCDTTCPGNQVCISCQRKHIQTSLNDTKKVVACAYCKKPFSACVIIAKDNDGIEIPLEVTIHSCGKSSHISREAVEVAECNVGDSVCIVNDKMLYTDEAKSAIVLRKYTSSENEKVYLVRYRNNGPRKHVGKRFGDKIYKQEPEFALSERKQQMCALLAGNDLEPDANEMEGEEKEAYEKLETYAALLSLMGWDTDPLDDELIAAIRKRLLKKFLCLEAFCDSNIPPTPELKAVARELDDILRYAEEKEKEWNAFSFVSWRQLSFQLEQKLSYARDTVKKILECEVQVSEEGHVEDMEIIEDRTMFLLTLAENIFVEMQSGEELREAVYRRRRESKDVMETKIQIRYKEGCREDYFIGAEYLADSALRRRVGEQFEISLNSYEEDGFWTVVECSLKGAEKICTQGQLPRIIAANMKEKFNRQLRILLEERDSDDDNFRDSDDDSDDEAASSSVLGKRERA